MRTFLPTLILKLRRSPCLWLLVAALFVAISSYAVFGWRVAERGRETVPIQIIATADIAAETQALQPFAALDPALSQFLLHNNPIDNPQALSLGAIPPIGAYLPDLNSAVLVESIGVLMTEELGLPNLQAQLLNFDGLPITSDLVGTVEILTYETDGCAPAGYPATGILTQRYHRLHSGLDIGVPIGTPVFATHSGTVNFAGWSSYGYGYLLILENAPYITYYAHLINFNVKTGDKVGAGSVIGWSGSTGNSTGPHIHYETRINDSTVDPITFIDRGLGTC